MAVVHRRGPGDPLWDPSPLGTIAEVHTRISTHLPGVDWSDPNWGLYSGDGFTFEFNVRSEEPIQAVPVHVRGSGNAIADLLKFTVPNGWHLLDGTTGEFIDPDCPSPDGWQGWQAYRDKIRQEFK